MLRSSCFARIMRRDAMRRAREIRIPVGAGMLRLSQAPREFGRHEIPLHLLFGYGPSIHEEHDRSRNTVDQDLPHPGRIYCGWA